MKGDEVWIELKMALRLELKMALRIVEMVVEV